MSWERLLGIPSVWSFIEHLGHCRKRWDYFVSPLLRLAESCLNIASVLFYLEATTRIHGKLAWTQVNAHGFCRHMCVRGNKLKEKVGHKIEDLQQPQASNHTAASSSGTASAGASAPQRMQRASPPLKEEVDPGKWISLMSNSTSAKLKQ